MSAEERQPMASEPDAWFLNPYRVFVRNNPKKPAPSLDYLSADYLNALEAKLARAEERLQVAVDVIANHPRIQHLRAFPHLTPNSWEQAALETLAKLDVGPTEVQR